jgi:uncharacterized protein (DUF2252 family)
MEQMIQGYQEALSNRSAHYKDFAEIPKPVQAILKQAYKREWRHLAEERIKNVKPSIPLGDCFWKPSVAENRAIKALFETKEVRKMVTSLQERADDPRVRVVDAAYWMKGCSSLGRLRYAILVHVGKKHGAQGELCIFDIKEATKAAAPRSARGGMPKNNARRVVEGASKLSPFLGQRMVAARFMGRDIFLRELMPQDLKLELDKLTCNEAVLAARFLASVVGKAHGRQMDAATRKSWSEQLGKHRSKGIDAPSWLWTSVVDLVASHEAAYLEHCREFAIARQRLTRQH